MSYSETRFLGRALITSTFCLFWQQRVSNNFLPNMTPLQFGAKYGALVAGIIIADRWGLKNNPSISPIDKRNIWNIEWVPESLESNKLVSISALMGVVAGISAIIFTGSTPLAITTAASTSYLVSNLGNRLIRWIKISSQFS